MRIRKVTNALAFTSILSLSSIACINHANANAAMTALSGAVASDSSSSKKQNGKNPQDEIARRMTIIRLAEGSDDDVLIAEADIARAELAGYQAQRAGQDQRNVDTIKPATQKDEKSDDNALLTAMQMMLVFLGGMCFGASIRGYFQ